MSLSKIQRIDEIVVRRDSFSDRVCDDLSEVILQYLSLEDKLKLECVSKQFQRTIFEKHYVFDERFLRKFNAFPSDSSINTKRRLKYFSSIVKKCQNLKTIKLFNSQLLASNLKIISNKCKNFPKIKLDFNSLSDEILAKDIQKFGSNFKSFRILSGSDWNRLISLQDIEELYLDRQWIPLTPETITQLNFDRLNKCEIILTDENIESIDVLFHKFKSLRHLEVINECIYETSAQLIINEISKLKKLIDLRLRGVYSPELLNEIGVHCRQLKRIDYSSFINSSIALIQVFYQLNQSTIFSLKSIKESLNLTHLRLNLYFYWNIEHNFIEDIETVFPNLQSLELNINFEGNFDELKQRLIGLITRMERLQTIVFDLRQNKERFEKIIEKIVIKTSRKPKSIEFIRNGSY